MTYGLRTATPNVTARPSIDTEPFPNQRQRYRINQLISIAIFTYLNPIPKSINNSALTPVTLEKWVVIQGKAGSVLVPSPTEPQGQMAYIVIAD